MIAGRKLFRQLNLARVVVFAALSISLTGCFDLSQKVEIGRDGTGSYQVQVAAEGLIGQALKEKPAHIDGMPDPQVVSDPKTGITRQTSRVQFKSLADLKLSDEVMSLHVVERPFFGLGPAHMRFRRTFLIGNAKKQQSHDAGRDDEMGRQVLQSMFGGHTYVFSVTLPGDVIKAEPIRFGDTVIDPVIGGDAWNGHTVTWSMPLYLALSRQMLVFQADFSAYGTFTDVESKPKGT